VSLRITNGDLGIDDLRIAAATVALCLVISVAAPPEATFFGRTGLCLGFVAFGIAAGFLAASSRAQTPSTAKVARIDRRLLFSVACVVALLGASVIAGNFRIVRVQFLVDRTDAQAEGGKGQTTRYEVWAVGDPVSYRVTRTVYEMATNGRQLFCTGVRSPLLGVVLTSCGTSVPPRS
jgi:hypothetical protein